VKAINAEYKALHNDDPKKLGTFDKVLNELKKRVQVFLAAEEIKRHAIARQAAKEAAELAAAALAAEKAEQEALANAAVGEADVDVAAVTEAADTAFSAFKQADHKAAIATKDAHVKLGGGFARSLSLRTKETLTVTDAVAAVQQMGATEQITAAILTSARAFREAVGELPDGVEATTTREI
jgi:ABC-type lipoprotein release transport system permease subunit